MSTSTSRTTDFTSIELSVAVEPTSRPLGARETRTVEPRAQQQLQSTLQWLSFPVKFMLTVVAFLIVIAYMVPVMVLQGVGMLGMMVTMPKIMIYVYPSWLGQIHVLVLWAWRKISLGDEGHSRSVRTAREEILHPDAHTPAISHAPGPMRPACDPV